MLYRDIIGVSSEIHTKHINTLYGQNVELLSVKLVVHKVTTGLYMVQIMIIEVWLHAFVTSALDGGQWPHSTFDRFALGKGSLMPIT
jgi:hypothetical protein